LVKFKPIKFEANLYAVNSPCATSLPGLQLVFRTSQEVKLTRSKSVFPW